MVGFPDDTSKSIRGVCKYAKIVGPTYANFNVVTPYPGTEFFDQVKEQIANFDYTQYSVYTPVMKYRNLSSEQVAELHAQCFTRYYFRWQYLKENAHLFWPILQKLPSWRPKTIAVEPDAGQQGPPPPKSGLEILQHSAGLRKDGPHVHTISNKTSNTQLRH